MIRKQESDFSNASQLASVVGVSPAYLRRAFLRERGVTPSEYVRRVRLLRALEVLAGSDAKVEPLALQVGYRSKKNFYRAFKQLTKLTPVEFRRLPADAAREIIEAVRVGLLTNHLSRKHMSRRAESAPSPKD